MSGPPRFGLPGGLEVQRPAAGRVLAVLVTSERCEPCRRVRSRLDNLVGVDVQEVDASRAGTRGVDRVPQLWLVDAAGDVVRHWVGEPLAGVLERTVANALGR